MNPEAALQRAILSRVSRGRWRWSANPRGKAILVPPGTLPAAVNILAAHGIHGTVRSFGVGPNGATDLLGIETVTIRPEHVGQVFARACVAEVKTPKGRTQENQITFLRTAVRLGMRAFLWRSVEQAKEETR